MPGDAWALGLMLAPTAGALLARYLGPGVIVWGRPNLWILAGILPGVAGLAGYWIAAQTGVISVDGATPRRRAHRCRDHDRVCLHLGAG